MRLRDLTRELPPIIVAGSRSPVRDRFSRANRIAARPYFIPHAKGGFEWLVQKLIVMYPTPTDMDTFERNYHNDHIPMAAPIFLAAGATKAVLTKITGIPAGAPPFHRISEIP